MSKALIILLLCTLIGIVVSKNENYIISIESDDITKPYDDETLENQKIMNTLVNDRMNDIYLIMYLNKNTYASVNGEPDENLNEFDTNDNITDMVTGKKKLDFIDTTRTENNSNKSYNPEIEYVKFQSKLVNYICPVSNYYTIRAYLSDAIVEEIKQLPNVISCEKSVKLEKYE